MLSAALKDRIGALPGGQFTQCWACIEEINEAIDKAGPTAVLALTYVRTLHEERLAQLLTMQESRIAHLKSSVIEQHESIASLATGRNSALNKIAKLEKRIARLTKKTKKSR